MSEVFWSAFGGGIAGGMVAALAGLLLSGADISFQSRISRLMAQLDMRLRQQSPHSARIQSQFTSIPGLVIKLKEMGKKPEDLKCVWFKTATGREFRGAIDKGAIKIMSAEYNKNL